MLPDLRLGGQLHPEILQEEIDLWQSGTMEQAFFREDTAAEATGPEGKRKRKEHVNRRPQRKLAFMQLSALDTVLRKRLGKGLEHFFAAARTETAPWPPANSCVAL